MSDATKLESANSSTPPLRVLILEDSPRDAKLIASVLEGGGARVQYEVIDSLESLREGLEKVEYDVILADFNLHNWTAIDALEALKQSGKDIPLIVVTGSLGDEAAAECIKQGAADFVLKDRPARLPAAVQRAREEKRHREKRKQAEEDLRKSEKKYRQLHESMIDGFVRVDIDGKITETNEAFCRIVKYAPEELLRLTYQELTPEKWHAFEADIIKEQVLRRGYSEIYLKEFHRRDGAVIPVELRNYLMVEDSGDPCGMWAIVRDITERKCAEQALQEYEKVVEGSRDMIAVVDRKYRFLLANRAFLDQRGLGPGEVVGSSLPQVWGEEFFARVIKAKIEECFEGNVVRFEMKHQYSQRGERDLLASYFPIEGNDGVDRVACVLQDITERKRAEEALSESEERFRSLVENATVGIYRTTPQGRVVMVNPAMARMLGYEDLEELKARNLEEQGFGPGYARSVFRENLEQDGEVKGLEAAWKRRDGSVIFVRESARAVRGESGKVLYYDGIVEDVTERKGLEEQVRQATKMEAIGRLAGGVAHDFNNLLTIINGYSEILLEKLGLDNTASSQLKEINNAGERAASLTRQLLAFSRRQVLAPQVLDLNSVVANLEKMLRRLIGEDIKLRTVLDPALGQVKADPGQLEQVIMNLVVNARDAMPLGGSLTIETGNAQLDEAYAHNHVTVKPGPHIMLAVSDSGVGMTTETKARIFEPFFTTKEKGQGTGLGLATVYGIVQQSGGSIWVYSELGQGSVFKVYLPAVGESLAVGRPLKAQADSAAGSETLLVVEDEEGVRSLVCETLKLKGYQVVEARDPAEALTLAAQHAKPIHLLLTDVVMPQMSGTELAKRLTGVHPESKVLYMSGYTDDAIVRHGVLEAGTFFLQKPFGPSTLAKKVREVLDAKRQEG